MQDLGSPERLSPVPEASAASGVETRQVAVSDLFFILWAADQWCDEHAGPDNWYREFITLALRRTGFRLWP